MQSGELVEVAKPLIPFVMTIITWAWNVFAKMEPKPEKAYTIERKIVLTDTYTISRA